MTTEEKKRRGGTRAMKTGDTPRGKSKGEKCPRSPRFEVAPSGLRYTNKNLITWLFPQKHRGRIVERTAAAANGNAFSPGLYPPPENFLTGKYTTYLI